MKVIIVGGVAGGASCAARLRRLDEEGRNPHGRTRTVRFLRELRAALPRRRRDCEGIEPPGRERTAVPRALRDRCADELRGDRHFAEEEDRRSAQRQDRRGHDRVLRQAGAVARRAFGPSAAARHRSAGDLPRENRARRADDPRVDRTGHDVPDRDVSTTRAFRW